MRRLLTLLCALSVVVAGCAGSPSRDSSTTTPSAEPTADATTESPTTSGTRTTYPTVGPNETIGYIEAEAVEDAPPNATVVNASHSAIANATPIQEAVREAVRTDGNATVEFTRRENRNVSAGFDGIPRHDSGWYVRYDGQVVRLVYAVQ